MNAKENNEDRILGLLATASCGIILVSIFVFTMSISSTIKYVDSTHDWCVGYETPDGIYNCDYKADRYEVVYVSPRTTIEDLQKKHG